MVYKFDTAVRFINCPRCLEWYSAVVAQPGTAQDWNARKRQDILFPSGCPGSNPGDGVLMVSVARGYSKFSIDFGVMPVHRKVRSAVRIVPLSVVNLPLELFMTRSERTSSTPCAFRCCVANSCSEFDAGGLKGGSTKFRRTLCTHGSEVRVVSPFLSDVACFFAHLDFEFLEGCCA